MGAINEFMTRDHRRCDVLMADAEAAVNDHDWGKAEQLTRKYVESMEHHFLMEEQVLFPTFEEQTGIVQGPTMIMKGEHRQMRGLMTQLLRAMERRDDREYLDTSETLLVMMQQHNMKEEGMLYPMSDEQLSGVDKIVADMQKV
ncbi:MAG: hemerythrin domain-containing protein [Gammaproteobacteria bacterium]|jgi:hemerythrin-like domain-containing protein|nr:MAG: hemerythrin domain-containing protein [Gammaproteobacteria bacterium]